MEIYDDTHCCDMAPAPAPVEIPQPAPLPAYEPPAPVAPAAEIFPEVPAAPVVAPVTDVTPVLEAPAPQPVFEPVQPLAPAPLSSGTLLGPSTVGGSSDLGSGFVGGAPDLGGSTVGGSTTADLAITPTHNGTPNSAFAMPLEPGSHSAAAANIMNAHNAVINSVQGGSSSTEYPAPWTRGYDSDRDGILNERDARPTSGR